jgi:hypothetical protein
MLRINTSGVLILLAWLQDCWYTHSNSSPSVPYSNIQLSILASEICIVDCILYPHLAIHTVCTWAHSCDHGFCWEVDHSTSSTKSNMNPMNPPIMQCGWTVQLGMQGSSNFKYDNFCQWNFATISREHLRTWFLQGLISNWHIGANHLIPMELVLKGAPKFGIAPCCVRSDHHVV